MIFSSATKKCYHNGLKGIQVKFFTVDQNVGKSRKWILTKFELSTFFHFQDITVQSYQFSSYTSVAILPVLQEKINFSKVDSNLLEKQLIYSSDSLLYFGNNTDKNTFESYKHAVTF